MRTIVTTACLSFTFLAAAACGSEDLAANPEAPGEGPSLTAVGKADGTDVAAYAALAAAADLSRPLEALFAPDDPVNTLEVQLIEEVITARAATEGSFAEGENPFRIRYVVYNLRNPFIVDALIEAEATGVDVQVLIEADQLSPAKTWNTTDETMVAAGLELAPSHRDLSAEGRRTADLVGITGSGLMHLKARLYETPEWSKALSGSLNPGDHSVHNEETLHLINDSDLIAAYGAAFDAILAGQGLSNSWDEDAAVNVMFTPTASGPRPLSKIFEWVASEQEQILLMVFSLRDVANPAGGPGLVDLLASKKAEGVDVFVITDRKQSDGVDADGNTMYWNDSTEDRLRAAGVPVYEATNRATPFTAMHHKVAVLGRTNVRVITDAANWTRAGLGSGSKKAKNHESVLFIDSAAHDDNRTGRRYLAQWLRVLERYASQSEAAGEASYSEVASHLAQQPGWPSEDVTFVAHETYTAWGEGAAVVGDADALGRWTLDGGVFLGTDGDSYPTWTSIVPVALPLGGTIEWKLVTERDGTIAAWEGGDNRASRVAPQALVITTSLEGSWR